MAINNTQLENDLNTALEREGWTSSVVNGPIRVDEFGDTASAEIVLSDAAQVDAVREVLRDVTGKGDLDLVIRGIWRIVTVGDLQPAYGPSGGLRAATLIPITVASGNRLVQATVSITKLAEIGFQSILGRPPDLKRIARMVIENALKLGGSSAWNPEERDYFEVASNSVANLSRGLRNVA